MRKLSEHACVPVIELLVMVTSSFFFFYSKVVALSYMHAYIRTSEFNSLFVEYFQSPSDTMIRNCDISKDFETLN